MPNAQGEETMQRLDERDARKLDAAWNQSDSVRLEEVIDQRLLSDPIWSELLIAQFYMLRRELLCATESC